jgi:hypothetical protein
MNVHSRRLYSFLLALGLGLGAAACGSNAASPTAPGASSGPAGATLQGTVVGGVAGASTGPGSVHALSTAGIQVSVTGTSLVTMTDSSGKFVLTGVPAGPVELHFQGPGVNARLTISTTAGQTLTITVNVTGGQATLEPEGDEGGVDLKGPIQSIDMGAGTLMVGGKKVTTNADTRIVAGDESRVSLSALKVGDTVDVQGTTQPDMSVLAKSIHVEQSGDKGGDKSGVDFKGPIQSIDSGAGSLMVAGKKVTTNADTKIVGKDDAHLTFSSLKVGANIQVHGTTQADMSVLAKTIQLQDSTGDDGGETELKGKIQSINTGAGTLVVGGKTVATDSKTRIRRDDKTLTLMDLKVNDSVDIQGTTRTDGTVLATEINVEGGD